LKSTTFVVELVFEVHARHPARVFALSFDNRRLTVSKADDAQEHDAENAMLDSNVQQQSGRWAQRARCP
jgi:hypothetical protein